MESIIYNDKWWLSNSDAELIHQLVDNSLKDANFTIFGFVEHHFSPMGYTALWLLGESHAAIHTFPEQKCAYIEVSSCVENLLFNFNRYLLIHLDKINKKSHGENSAFVDILSPHAPIILSSPKRSQ